LREEMVLSGWKVLLVDDEKDFVEPLGERLRFRGLKISTALSAKQAVKMTDKGDYDVVVLDLKMSEIDGLETLRLMKRNNPDIHVILLTGYATAEKAIPAMLSGAEEILEKPSDVEVLVRKIHKLVTEKMVKV